MHKRSHMNIMNIWTQPEVVDFEYMCILGKDMDKYTRNKELVWYYVNVSMYKIALSMIQAYKHVNNNV
jgi:hypothetical protein